jgi:hypothetical protein
MIDPFEPPPEEQLEFLRVLEQENAAIAGNIVPMGDGLWGIHGDIAVDGDVLMAEFTNYDDARRVLDQFHREHEPESPFRFDVPF